MRNETRFLAIVMACTTALAPVVALGADFYGNEWSYAPQDDSVELRGSIGAVGIRADEYVFNLAGSDSTTSHLIWQSVAPMATMGLSVRLPDEWTVEARARAALFGMSYMEDYDWFGPDFVSYNFDDWTHQSRHPNTNLEWFLDASLAIGRNVVADPGLTLNVNGGFKYTDVKWTATGGSYIYSDSTVDNPGNNYRAYTGNFADVPVISYRQQLPVLFAGVDAEATQGEWTYHGSLQGGVTLFARATDDHWLRNLQFVDLIKPAPYVAATARADYAISDNLGLFVEGTIEKMFLGRADTETYNISTGALTGTFADLGGAELGTVSLSGGLKGSF